MGRDVSYDVAVWAGCFGCKSAAVAVRVGCHCVIGWCDAAFCGFGEGVCAGCVGRVAVGGRSETGEEPD